jgi:hypothetical protein
MLKRFRIFLFLILLFVFLGLFIYSFFVGFGIGEGTVGETEWNRFSSGVFYYLVVPFIKGSHFLFGENGWLYLISVVIAGAFYSFIIERALYFFSRIKGIKSKIS